MEYVAKSAWQRSFVDSQSNRKHQKLNRIETIGRKCRSDIKFDQKLHSKEMAVNSSVCGWGREL